MDREMKRYHRIKKSIDKNGKISRRDFDFLISKIGITEQDREEFKKDYYKSLSLVRKEK
jgi:hypothetical protein